MSELLVDLITSLDGYAAADGWPGWWGLDGPEYLRWLGAQPERHHTLVMGAATDRLMSGLAAESEEGTAELTATPKVVFSSTLDKVDWNTRLVTGDAVTEIARLKAEDDGPMDIGGATLAAAAMRAGLIDEYVLVTAPVLVGNGTPFFAALDNWVNLNLVETRTFPDGVILTSYETRR